MLAVDVLIGVLGAGAVWVATGVRVVQQFERGVVFRFGRVHKVVRDPGLRLLVPVADRLRKVNMQIVTMPVPAQEGITRDNVTVRVDAVIYFQVVDPVRATVNVQDYMFAMLQVAQTSLRSIIGKSELDDLLSNREALNQGLALMIDSPALAWGVHIDRVEIKDVALPESMKRSMARQAEADRERRARIITADGEYQASRRLSDAAQIMAQTPAALQLRLLQTVVEVAAEKNSTLVLPFPVELLRFLERATPADAADVLGGVAARVGGATGATAFPGPGPEAGEVAASAEEALAGIEPGGPAGSAVSEGPGGGTETSSAGTGTDGSGGFDGSGGAAGSGGSGSGGAAGAGA